MYKKISMFEGEYFGAIIADMSKGKLKQGLKYCNQLLAYNRVQHRKNLQDLNATSQEYARLEEMYVVALDSIINKRDELLVTLRAKSQGKSIGGHYG